MKKILRILLLFTFTFLLVACGGSEGNNSASVIDELEGIGYVFEQRNSEVITYYNENAVNDTFDIGVKLIDLYIAYIDGSQGWLELLVFDNQDDAIEYVEGVSEKGYLIYRDENTVFITFNEDALTPFAD